MVRLSDGRVAFDATDDVRGWAVWVSDGTAAGTSMLADPHPAGNPPPGRPPAGLPLSLTAVPGGGLFFTVDDGTHGEELWFSDGTSRDTRLVADLVPGQGSPFALGLVSLGDGRVSFVGRHGDGSAIWVSDGTAAGTRTLAGLPTDSFAHTSSAALPGGGAMHALSKGGIWVTDGFAPGTHRLEIPDGAVPVRNLSFHEMADGQVAFAATLGGRSSIYVTDGTGPGTRALFDLEEGQFTHFNVVDLGGGRSLVQTSALGSNYTVVYVTDGSPAGTFRVEGNWAGVPGDRFVPVPGGGAIHVEPDAATGLNAVWLVDGGSRTLLLAPSAGNPSGSDLRLIEAAPGRTVFLSNTVGDGPDEIWTTDGTAAGTRLLATKDVSVPLGHETMVPVLAPRESEPCPPPAPPAQPDEAGGLQQPEMAVFSYVRLSEPGSGQHRFSFQAEDLAQPNGLAFEVHVMAHGDETYSFASSTSDTFRTMSAFEHWELLQAIQHHQDEIFVS
nr:hypothetical protein [Pseudoroseomonas vastitatis]